MKTPTKSLVLVAAVLGFGVLAFLSGSGARRMKEVGEKQAWAGKAGIPPGSDMSAARIAELPPALLTQARW